MSSSWTHASRPTPSSHLKVSLLIAGLLALIGASRAMARPLPKPGDDFFVLLAAYQDSQLQLKKYVTDNLRQLDPEKDPVEWVRNFSFYRITASDNGDDVLKLNSRFNEAMALALKHRLYAEYLSFKVTELEPQWENGFPKDWRQELDRMVQEAQATGDHRVVAEITRVYANFLIDISTQEAAAMAQKALEE